MHVELARALAPVLADVESTAAPVPRVVDDGWAEGPGTASAMLWDAAGTHGRGVAVELGLPRPQQVASVAEEVQDWVVDELWAGWPACPRHPGTHPMEVRVVDAAARWTCPKDGTAVAVVGTLR